MTVSPSLFQLLLLTLYYLTEFWSHKVMRNVPKYQMFLKAMYLTSYLLPCRAVFLNSKVYQPLIC